MATSHSTPTENEEQYQEEHQVEELDQQVEEQVEEQQPEPETDENQFARLLEERKKGKSFDVPEMGTEVPDQGTEETEPEPEPEPDTEPNNDFATWPEAARAEVARMQDLIRQQQNENDALRGRLIPTQRQLSDLQKQLQQLKSAPPPTPKDLEENNAYKEIVEEFPEHAEELKKLFGSQQQVLQTTAQQQQQLQQALETQRQEVLRRELRRLSVRYPNYQAINADPMFSMWIEANPSYRNVIQSTDSDFVIDAIDKFKRDLVQVDKAAFTRLFPTASQPKPKPSRPSPPKPSPPSQGSGMSGVQRQGAPMTAEQQFAEYLAKKRRS